MSSSVRLHRPVQHVCYIVNDIPAAVERWVEGFGAGPFYWLGRHIEFDELYYRHGDCVFDHSSVIGRWGNILVELSELHDVRPASFDAAFRGRARDGGGVAHVSYIVDDAAAESARLERIGMPEFFRARQGPIAITFHESPELGHAIEIHQHGEVIDGMFAAIRAGAEGWDDSQPLRELG
jgi:catechol 2,3-dioxygenase-like lactoylglutathione lyase family enzyme